MASQSIAQVFAAKKLWAWFDSTVTNRYDGVSEKGQDYSTTFGTAVCVPVGGAIVRIAHNNNSIGDVVELQDSTGAVWLYQHISATVKVGNSLQCGSQIGTENGLPIDQYSTGPHIEVRYCPSGWSIGIDSWNESWINPASIFAGIGGQTAGSVATNPFSALASFVAGTGVGGGKAPISIAPNADVTALLGVLDQVLSLTNPFTTNMSNIQRDTIAGLSFTDPVAWVGQFGQNMVDDMSALVVRFLFILLGIFVLYKVLSAFIDFGQLAQTVASGAETAGKAAVLFA